ncbi:MAG: hypothetical protein KBT06_07515 [Prevotellaceae bacterium]|nr:hypothetical protein [Candidatus Colivivens equi]
MDKSIYCNKDYIAPTIAVFLLVIYQCLASQKNFNGWLTSFMSIVIFYALFQIKKQEMLKLIEFITKSLACFLALSLPFYFFYLLGFNLPNSSIVYGDYEYSFSNYYFFLIDDRFWTEIIPRFHSVFLEPGHLGTACALLLLTQCGKWKKWYCLILMLSIFLSFSLTGYIMLVVITFLNMWIQRKHILVKIIVVLFIVGCFIGGAFIYNHGNNLVHDLILLRMEIDDGELVGDNRVSESFEADFENLLNSPSIIFGKELDLSIYENEGNSGFRVFLYENGIVGTFLLILFYYCTLRRGIDKRAIIAAIMAATMEFIALAYPLWFCHFIPIFITANVLDFTHSTEQNKNENCLCTK